MIAMWCLVFGPIKPEEQAGCLLQLKLGKHQAGLTDTLPTRLSHKEHGFLIHVYTRAFRLQGKKTINHAVLEHCVSNKMYDT
jgi:hypothetical protein